MMRTWMTVALIWLGWIQGLRADEVGTSWRRVDPAESDSMSYVCWDGPLIVGVGERGWIGTSTDGKAWDTRFQEAHLTLRAVAWSGTCYVAVGDGGTIIRSANGMDWQRIEAAATDITFTGIAWTGAQFVAVDFSYHLSTSPDGFSWSRSPSSISELALGIEHLDGATYLRTSSGIHRSTDLVDWTKVLSSQNVQAPVRKYNGKLFSVGNRDTIHSSEDGITWTPGVRNGVTFPQQNLRDVAWSGDCYVAVGTSNLIWRSEDGLTWTTRNSAATGAAYVRWIGGEFVAAGERRIAQTSPDGRDWTVGRIDAFRWNAPAVWTGSRYVAAGSYGYIATSPDLESWTIRDTGVFSHLRSLVWTGSFLLASGAEGVVLKSADGLEWTQVPGGDFTGDVRLVWTGAQVFAFSSSGTHTSTDGISWTRISTESAGTFDELRWLRGMFIGVMFTGEIRTSPDGVVWTPQTSGTTASLFAIGASGDGFLAGGSGGVLLASPDGIEWSPRSFPATAVISALEHRFGRWIAATAGGIYHSLDGISWIKVPEVAEAPLFYSQVKLVWTGGTLVCTGLDAWTTDGTNWHQLEIPTATPDLAAVAKGIGGYVAVGSAGAILHSPDGYAWTRAASPTGSALRALAAGSGAWVAVGDGGVIVTSTDGIHWSLRNSGTATNLTDIAWNGRRFAAVGEGGTILTSTDGASWSPHATGSTAAIKDIVATGLAFQAFADRGTSFQSPDGTVWTTSVPDWIADVVWNGTSYVGVGDAVGEAHAHVSSPDALQWTRHPMGTTAFLTGICWTGTLHVACGTGGTIMTSPDGITWTQRESGTTQWIQAVLWNGTQLVAVGQMGTMLVSPDGITWTQATKPLSGNFEDVAWVEGRYVAVGQNGASATSTDGQTWQFMSGSPGSNLTVERIGTRFLAAGSALSGTTGTQWVSETRNGHGAAIYDFEWDGSRLFAAAEDGVIRFEETAARRWNGTRVHASPTLDNMVRNGSEYVATGSCGTVVLSRDGLSWRTIRGGRQNTFDALTWNGSLLVGVGGTNRILLSPDGAVWNPPLSPTPGPSNFSLNEVIWTGSRFLGMGPSGIFLSTPDAESWTRLGIDRSPAGIAGVAGDDDFLVAVGAGGIIAISDGSGAAAGDFHAWMAEQGAENAETAPLQDANGDGISNLIAYIHGIPAAGSPAPAQRAALPAVTLDPATGAPVLTFDLLESYRPGASYFLEVSPDMNAGSWQILQEYSAGWATGPDHASVSESPLPGGGVRITVTDFPEIAAYPICFFRLRVALP